MHGSDGVSDDGGGRDLHCVMLLLLMKVVAVVVSNGICGQLTTHQISHTCIIVIVRCALVVVIVAKV